MTTATASAPSTFYTASAMALSRTALLLMALLLCSPAARAEAALADLIFLLPQMLLAGLYQELARPWVWGGLWAAAGLCWVVYALTGRDVMGFFMARSSGSSARGSSFTSYGAFTFWAVICSLYVLVGSFFVGVTDAAKRSTPSANAAAPAPPPRPADTPMLRYPHGKSEANPRGEWPTTSGPLPGLRIEAHGGNAYLMLRNPGSDGLWVRLCVADLAPACIARREVYIAPRHPYLLERVGEGRYHLAFAEVTGALRSGTTAPFRVRRADWDGLREMVVDESGKPVAPPAAQQ